MAHLSELTHCLARKNIPSFEQCKQIRATLARRPCAELVLLPQGKKLVFSPTGNRATKKKKKKKETRKRGRKNISFRADCKFRGPKSQRFLNQKVFVLSSAPFLTMLRRRRAPSWDLPCVCTLTTSACAGRAPRRFWLSKTDLKTALQVK